MAERNRLAGELHDTILQTIQASKLIADNARLDHSADPVRLREAMNSVSEWLSQATTEARAALNSLRESTSQRNDLAEALQQAAEASQAMASMKFVLSVEGTARDLHPIVRDEIYRIGSEAIRNAARHSGGTELHADLTYGSDLVLRISDNGLGMTEDLTVQGLPDTSEFLACTSALRAFMLRFTCGAASMREPSWNFTCREISFIANLKRVPKL